MTGRKIHLVVCLFLLFCGLSPIAGDATLCVSQKPNSGCPFTSINAAVAAASPGDVIQVSQGTYHEDVVIGKAVSLIGRTKATRPLMRRGWQTASTWTVSTIPDSQGSLFPDSRSRMQISRASS
jgi:nitrous oxidase accessory protein NosD